MTPTATNNALQRLAIALEHGKLDDLAAELDTHVTATVASQNSVTRIAGLNEVTSAFADLHSRFATRVTPIALIGNQDLGMLLLEDRGESVHRHALCAFTNGGPITELWLLALNHPRPETTTPE